MKKIVVATLVVLAAVAARAEQKFVPVREQDGSIKIVMVDTQTVVEFGPEKGGKHPVVLFVDGKRYEGSVAEVKGPKK